MAKEMRFNTEVTDAKQSIESAQKELKKLLGNAKAVKQALEGVKKHSEETAQIWAEGLGRLGKDIFRRDLAGGLADSLDLIIELNEHSDKSIPYLERIKDELNKLLSGVANFTSTSS